MDGELAKGIWSSLGPRLIAARGKATRAAPPHGRRTYTTGMASRFIRLRVPTAAVRGTTADVSRVLPILCELSVGARRGVPGWVPTTPLASAALTKRQRKASWLEITYPFSSDEELRNYYMLGDGESLRAGMFLEELDAFSGDCSARHADIYHPDRKLSLVTAAHSGLSIFENLSAKHDLRLRGCVVSVGSTSMEVRTDLLRVLRRSDAPADAVNEVSEEHEEYLGCCYTVMVARETSTFSKAQVHALSVPPADAARSMRRSEVRKELAANALSQKPPSEAEVPVLHALFVEAMEARARDSGGGDPGGGEATAAEASLVRVPMGASEQRALDIMQPAHRNMNGYMFGGYLMRRALEVGWLSAYRFFRSPPAFAGLDEVVFNKPVEMGDVIELVGRGVYASETCEDETLRVFVEANKLSLSSGRREATNVFHFIFRPPRPSTGEHGRPRRAVLPDTYEEGMLYLEGRRRWLNSQRNGQRVQTVNEIFLRLDADGDGRISRAELKHGLEADAEAKALLGERELMAMRRLDLDGDGEITWEEFSSVLAAE